MKFGDPSFWAELQEKKFFFPTAALDFIFIRWEWSSQEFWPQVPQQEAFVSSVLLFIVQGV